MRQAQTWSLNQPLVHVIDREADGLAQFRQWHEEGFLFLVRIDAKRRVEWRGESRLVPDIVRQPRATRAFERVESFGEAPSLWVAETSVRYTQAGRVRRGSKRKLQPGTPLTLRLIVSQIRDAAATVLAEWLLVTNVASDVTPRRVGEWYAWRWRIESLFKLLKSQGHQVEAWQQESGAAVAKRLAVALMACVVVWRLQADGSVAGAGLRKWLIRLSGRQLKRGQSATASALLAGLERLLALLSVVEEISLAELRHLLRKALPGLIETG